jgi:hypothetical protein
MRLGVAGLCILAVRHAAMVRRFVKGFLETFSEIVPLSVGVKPHYSFRFCSDYLVCPGHTGEFIPRNEFLGMGAVTVESFAAIEK